MNLASLFTLSMFVSLAFGVAARAQTNEQQVPLNVHVSSAGLRDWSGPYHSPLDSWKPICPQIPVQLTQGKWPDFQPGPGGKDRWEQSGGGYGVIGPDGKYTVVPFPPRWPAPIVPLIPPVDTQYPAPTAVPQATTSLSLADVKNEVEELRNRLHQIQERLAELEKSKRQ